MNGLWARVEYKGKNNGWVLTANKRGAMLIAVDDDDTAEAKWAAQVLRYSSALVEASAIIVASYDIWVLHLFLSFGFIVDLMLSLRFWL